jgi:hypothetical protein
MNTFLTIWNKPLKTFKYLETKSDNEVENRTSFLFVLLGLLSALNSFLNGRMEDFGLVFKIISVILSAGLGIIIGRFLISYPIYWLSKLFKGESSIDGVRMSFAYSIIPNFLIIPWLIYLRIDSNNVVGNKIVYWIHLSIGNVLWIATMTILVIGLKHYNKFGYFKAIMTVSPFIIAAIVLRIIMY